MSEEFDKMEATEPNPFRAVTEDPQRHHETRPLPESDSDSDDAELESDIEESESPGPHPKYAATFDLDCDIDLDAPFLQDLLTPHAGTMPKPPSTQKSKSATGNRDEDFIDWDAW